MRPLAVIFDPLSSTFNGNAKAATATIIALVVLLLPLAACGGHSHTSTNTNAIQVSPSPLSLNLGEVASLSATIVDSNGATVANTSGFTYSSSNSSVATVSSGGLVCAGKWDASFIVCDTTGVQPGSTTLTVSSGTLSTSVTVFTHLHVDRVTISPGVINCVSSNQTQQMSAKAFNNGVDITSTVGAFTWKTNAIDVATVDTNGVVTAKAPGQTGVIASVSNVSSTTASWVTCPVQSINIHTANSSDTKFTLGAAGNTVNLAADVLDSHGVSISAPLTWSSSIPAVASISSTALVTAVAPGTTSLTASCAGTCNQGLGSVYSNVVLATVSGSSSSTVYATGTGSTSLIPIDTNTNAAGTAITLPSTPNSFRFNRLGSAAYLGSSAGLMTLDPNANTVAQNTSVQGTVLAVSPDSNRVIISGTNIVYVLGVGSGITTETSPIVGATAADFTPDSRGAYIVAGSTVYFWTQGSFTPFTLTGPATDVRFLANGAFAYVAGGAPGNSVTARATCNNFLADTVATPGAPVLVASLPDASAVLAADLPGLDVIAVSSTRLGCPPPVSDTLTHLTYGVPAFTPKQLIVLPDGSRGYETGSPGALLGVTTSGFTPFTVTLAGSATPLTGGTTLDSTKLYVGGSDNAVHRIDVASGTDAQQITVSFTPDLVAVRPK